MPGPTGTLAPHPSKVSRRWDRDAASRFSCLRCNQHDASVSTSGMTPLFTLWLVFLTISLTLIDARLSTQDELADGKYGLTADWNDSSDRLDILDKLVSVLQNDKRRCRHGRRKKPDRYVQRQSASLLQSNSPSVIITRANRLKKDWCRTEPLWQKISERGCVSKTILNHFCYGQCNSFYIPQTSNKTFQSCPFCKPYSAKWTRVNLRCPSRMPFVKRIKVLLVQKCRCIAQVLR